MDITQKNRTDLKRYFVKNAIPTESNFADLIDAMLNQKEDGITKPAGDPLSIEATGDASSLKKAINFYESFGDPNPTWVVSLNPRVNADDPGTAKPGFAVTDSKGTSRLFIDRSTGNVGIGTASPANKLHIDVAASASPVGALTLDVESFGTAGNSQASYFLRVRDIGAAPPNGLTHFIIRGDGNVGIGTASPNAKLYVNNLDNSVGAVLATNAEGPGELRVRSYKTQPVNVSSFGIVHAFYNDERNGFINFWRGGGTNGGFLTFGTNGSERLRIDGNGNVSIGTAAAQRPLHVEGAEIHSGGPGAGFSFSNRDAPNNGAFTDGAPAGQRWVWYSANSIARLWTNTNGDRMYVNAAGFVGFGTPPAFPFDVRAAGRIKLGLEGMGGGQLQIACNPNDNSVYLEAFNAAGNGNANVFWLTGMNSGPVPLMNLQANMVHISGALSAGGGKGGYIMDQFVNAVDDILEEGDVVVIGSNQASLYYGTNNGIPVPEADLTTRSLDTRVCGIVCSVHGNVEPSETAKSGSQARALTHEELQSVDQTKVKAGQVGWMVTLGAYAHCKVDADIAPIEVGDLLATSPTKGHAQKVVGGAKAVGAILGKALGSLSSGKGKIPVLVTLH
jgi:hypothetical protein